MFTNACRHFPTCALHWLAKHAVRQPAKQTKAGCNAAIMNSQYSLYVNYLDVTSRDWYEKKLEYGDGADMLPDLYFMQDGWQNDPESNVGRR